MGVLSLKWGAGLIAFSPLAMLFVQIIFKQPELIVISILSAFAYLLALLLSSLIWIIIPPLQGVGFIIVAVGCACQLWSRYMLYRLYERTEYMIKSASHPHIVLPLNDITSSIASGVGYGLMHTTMLFGSVLASFESDPGVLYEKSCGKVPLVLVLAFQALAFSLLDLLLTGLVFLYLRNKQLKQLGVVYFIHLIAGCMTIFNELNNGCNVSLPLLYLTLAGASAFTYRELQKAQR